MRGFTEVLGEYDSLKYYAQVANARDICRLKYGAHKVEGRIRSPEDIAVCLEL